MISIADILRAWPEERVAASLAEATAADVEAALGAERRTEAQLLALLSPAARPYLEPMAQEAQRLTRWHFGRTMTLYAPLYLSNLCAADCVYCGFSARSGSREKRTTLNPAQIRTECEALSSEGFENVLLLTGEAPKVVTPAWIAEAIEIAREYFSSVSAEIYAVDEDEYRRFVQAGLEGVTLYMETYHRPTYREVHLLGGKANYDYRLGAMERAGAAGVRKLNVGALLGLFEPRADAFWAALHAAHLERVCWRSAIGISFPRLLHTPERFEIRHTVSDADLVQIIVALRLFLPEAGFNLSTRERPELRDRLIPLGFTHMSAGSSTQPGGYATYLRGQADERTNHREVLEQFAIDDHRPVADVVDAIRAAGYDPVWKDYDRAYDRA